MNETKSNSRTKPMRGDFKGGEINSLKDSEKTNENKKIMYPINIIIELFHHWTYKIGLEFGFIKKVKPGLRTKIKCKKN